MLLVRSYARACALCALMIIGSCGGGSDAPDAKPAGGIDAKMTVPDAPPTCSASTCAGCCAGTTCMTGNTNAACGRAGAACDACSGTEVCANHRCAAAGDPCQGIDANGICATSTSVE